MYFHKLEKVLQIIIQTETHSETPLSDARLQEYEEQCLYLFFESGSGL